MTSTFQKKSLPKMPLGILAMIGPAFIWDSFAQGSGELIWWPYLSAKYKQYASTYPSHIKEQGSIFKVRQQVNRN